MTVNQINEGDTLTIKKITYTVIKIEMIDAQEYPNRAKYVSGTVYMQRGNGKAIYSTAIDLKGNVRTDRKPVTFGAR